MLKQSLPNFPQNPHPSFNLKQQNLIPIYVIDDTIKQNFTKIQQFISLQQSQNFTVDSQISTTNSTVQKMDQKYTKELKEMQKVIFSRIKTEIEGTVTLVLNKQLSTILDKILENEAKQVQKEDEMKRNIAELEKRLKYEIAQENQKYFVREIGKIQKDIDKKIETIINDKSSVFSGKGVRSSSNNKTTKKTQIQVEKEKTQQYSHRASQSSQNNTNIHQVESPHSPLFQSQTRQCLENLKQKVEDLTEFRTQLDKKFTENFNTLKSSWKQLGLQLLDNKKVLNKKFQQISIDMIKLKNLSEFKPLPQTTDENFKKKILQKFTDFYKLISSLTSKTEFEMVNERNKISLNRFSGEVTALRDQFQKNTEYFTFYMNNSNTDDLKQDINKLKINILQDKKYMDCLIADLLKQSGEKQQSIENIVKSIGALEITNQTLEGKIQKIFLNLDHVSDKIKSLEDLNDIDPFKMKKIHETLDMELSFPDQNKTNSPKANALQMKLTKELKKQIELLKDQVFILASEKNMNNITEQDDIQELKNQMKLLKQRFEKLKLDNDEAQLSRKPWIVMNASEKHKSVPKQPTLQKDSSRKKISLEIGKGGGFTNNRNSEKNIVYNMMSSTPEEKFQVYEKYREKYLSDTLKLPEIFKEKLSSDELLK